MAIITSEPSLDAIKAALEEHIRPLLPGAALSGAYPSGSHSTYRVCYDSKYRLRVYASPKLDHYFVFDRSLPFTEEERSFLDQIMRDFCCGGFADTSPIGKAIAKSVVKSVAEYVAPEFPDTVSRIISLYEAWSGEHTERISHTIGIQPKRHKSTQGNFFDISGKDLVKLIGASPNTLMVLDAAGGIRGVEKIPFSNAETRGCDSFSPAAYLNIALWANTRQNVAIRLTEDGTILLFTRKRLLFAKRGSCWISPPHTLINMETVPYSVEGVEPEMVKAIYLTALDLAAAKKTARISLVRNTKGKQPSARLRQALALLASGKPSQNAKLLSVLVNGRKFYEIPRSIRVEICSMGGTLLLDGQGAILGLDLSGKAAADNFGSARETNNSMFPGKAYMELLNKESQSNLHLAIC